MSRLTIISDNDMVKLLQKLGFREVRQNGSYKFFLHSDGRCMGGTGSRQRSKERSYKRYTVRP